MKFLFRILPTLFILGAFALSYLVLRVLQSDLLFVACVFVLLIMYHAESYLISYSIRQREKLQKKDEV